MSNPLFLPELRGMLEADDAEGLAEVLTELHPATVAEFSEALNTAETWQMLDQALIEKQAEVFSFFSIDKQVEMATGTGRDRMSGMIEAMAPDDRVDLLQRLSPGVVERLLPLVARADRQDIRTLLSYPDESAGALMTTDYATLSPDVTVGEALSQLRLQAPDSETIYYIYVVDESRRLQGFISLRNLILAPPAARVEDLMQREVISVRVDEDQEQVADKLAQYNFLAIPVVDDRTRLVGIVTHDDVIDVVVEEATEDALHMAGVGTLVDSYLQTPFMTVWRKRSVWLSCLFVAEIFTFTALAHFEDAIAQVLALSLFVPLCISTGGNSGSQAATLITRALALGQVQPADWRRVLGRELLMGLALGATLGMIGLFRAAITPQSMLEFRTATAPPSVSGGVDRWMLAVVIGQSVAAICLWGTVVGATLPLVFKRFGIDPGYASSPFVATFVDVTGIVIYFSIATAYLF